MGACTCLNTRSDITTCSRSTRELVLPTRRCLKTLTRPLIARESLLIIVTVPSLSQEEDEEELVSSSKKSS
jgi:hypothetical protein